MKLHCCCMFLLRRSSLLGICGAIPRRSHPVAFSSILMVMQAVGLEWTTAARGAFLMQVSALPL